MKNSALVESRRSPRWRLSLAIGVVLQVAAQQTILAAPVEYRLTQTADLGGAGSWDYFEADPATHRVFIPRGSHLMVCSDAGSVLADVKGFKGAHAVALAIDLQRGYTANDDGRSVTIFDLKTYAVITEVDLGAATPDGILYDRFSHRVFTFNGGTNHSATVIDAVAGKVVARVDLGGKPETAQSDEAGRIYVNLQDKDRILTLDAASAKIVADWHAASCHEPAGLAINLQAMHLYVGCRNETMTSIDISSGKTLSTLPIGWLVDATRYDPGTGLIFSSSADGTLTIAREAADGKLELAQTLSTPLWARTMALDASTHKIFAVTSKVEPGPFPPGAAHPQRQGRAIPGTFTLLIYSPD